MDEVTRAALAAAQGQPHEIAVFVRLTQAEVWRVCARLVDQQTADDLTQETYLRAFRALPRFGARSSARTWLLSIAHHTCMDELRRRTRTRDTLLTRQPDRDQPHPDVAEQATVNDLLRLLDPDRRAAFVLTQLFGLSYDDAAAICGCPTGTIRSRVARARTDLIDALDARQHTTDTTTRRRPSG
ncbi:MAG TPA: sigma-70 family RNA polymerase sigma factor [Kineosporiaceae bacterium]